MLVGQAGEPVMEKMIEYYVPTSFYKKVAPRSASKKAKVIEFRTVDNKSA